MIDCLIIVVSYRSPSDVEAMLSTVRASVGEFSWHAVVVNNEPTDDLSTLVEAYPEVELVEAGANLGYAGGINLGAAAAPPSRWTLFLNPDVRLERRALAMMIRYAGEERAVVPAIVDDDGVIQASLRREPTILGSLGDALFGDRWQRRPLALSETIWSKAAYRRPGSVDWATGAALLVPTAIATQVGPWDEQRFFLYSEETDYCHRLRAAGTQIHFLPEAVLAHRGGGSGRSQTLHALMEVNRVRYFRKWHRAPAAATFAAVAVLNNLLRCRRARSRAALVALVSSRARAALPGGVR